MEDWLVIVLLTAVFSLVFSVITAMLSQMIRDWRITHLERQVESIIMQKNQERSVEKRNMKSERQAEALAKLAALVQSGKAPIDAVKEVGILYPDVAMELMKKGL